MGQSQALTTGWLSDAPAVATVTDAGLVTGVANGRATIYVIWVEIHWIDGSNL